MTAPAPFRIADHLRARWLHILCVAAVASALQAAGLLATDPEPMEASR